jgi:hypothetical protein
MRSPFSVLEVELSPECFRNVEGLHASLGVQIIAYRGDNDNGKYAGRGCTEKQAAQ